MDDQSLTGGFVEAPTQSAFAFRNTMQALARPGRIYVLEGATPPAPMSIAAGVLALTLIDAETKVHLVGAYDTDAIRTWITFQCNAPLVSADKADFAFGTWDDLRDLPWRIGTSEYPDRSVTLIVETENLSNTNMVLQGPGIEDQALLSLPELSFFKMNNARFPRGIDCFFVDGNKVAGLPRSTRIKEAN
jgi:alpha-D-ribose 1-methylphosphonate 5-triphosphate synthase subunit PhnH